MSPFQSYPNNWNESFAIDDNDKSQWETCAIPYEGPNGASGSGTQHLGNGDDIRATAATNNSKVDKGKGKAIDYETPAPTPAAIPWENETEGRW